MFKTYLKVWLRSWFAGFIAVAASLGTAACFGKWEVGGFEPGPLFAFLALAFLIVSPVPFGDTLKWAQKLGRAKVLRDWLDDNCKSITLTVEQLVKASWMKVYWLKGSPNLSEFLFNPSFLLEGDSEKLDVFMSSIPLRGKKPNAFIVEIETGGELYPGPSNFFFEAWRLSLLEVKNATACFLSDGFMCQRVEVSSRQSDINYTKALMIMWHFRNWAHYERTLTLVDVVIELEHTKTTVARSPEIRDLKEAIKEHILLGGGFENDGFRGILRDIREKNESAEEKKSK